MVSRGEKSMMVRNLMLLLAAAAASLVYAQDKSENELAAGSFTVPYADRNAYSQAAPALSPRQREIFLRGRAHFNRLWVAFGISAGDWGVGPTFVADRCSACHVGGGRGAPPADPNEQLLSMLVRLSVPGHDLHDGPKPHEHYGDQLQNRALQGQTLGLVYAHAPIPAEADIYLEWEESSITFADGERVDLRKPTLRIEGLAFGELGADVMQSLRNAQPVFGMGLLAAVAEETLFAVAAQQRLLGFNGRPNYVWDAIEQRTALGRFGWKANQPSVRQQIAAAAIGDLGATSNLFPRQNCPDVQVLCRREVPGNDPELSDSAWDDLELWTLGLGVPIRRNWDDAEVQRGAALFEQAQCSACHLSTLVTANYFARLPQLAKQTFHPYTDLLLHDMGEELADGRPDFVASGRDWRTPPLWGLGLSQVVSGSGALMHDARARNATEAILWHGGEAQGSRELFKKMPKHDRESLLKFLDAI